MGPINNSKPKICFFVYTGRRTHHEKAGVRARIVNMSSVAGRSHSDLTGPVYGSAKAGILGLTRYMAAELGPYGVTVNAVAPSIVMSQRVKAKFEARSEEERRKYLMNIPLGRLAEPEEVASAVAFLASDDASYINGVSLDVNGGRHMA